MKLLPGLCLACLLQEMRGVGVTFNCDDGERMGPEGSGGAGV